MVTGCYIHDVYVVDITSDKVSSEADVKYGSQWSTVQLHAVEL
jgi:hypothetical protein